MRGGHKTPLRIFFFKIIFMVKTYRIAKIMNNYSFVLQGKSGNSLRYIFERGSVVTNTPARLTLKTQYAQDLLEDSEIFKSGQVILERIDKEDEPIQGAPKVEYKNEESIKTVTQAVDYVAETWGEAVKTAKQAKEYAQKHGVDFPNLKVKA